MMNERQRALRAHIHGLLYPYALTHLTTDYVAFTQEAVKEALSAALYAIPETDPTSLILEPSLSELIADKFKLSELKEYQERLNVDQDAKMHLKDFFRSTVTDGQGRDSKSDRGWLEDDEVTHWEPMDPILTMRAIRATPRLRGKPASELVARSVTSLLENFKIQAAEVELLDLDLMREEEPTENVNDILGHKLAIDPETRSAVVDCIRESRALPRASDTPTNTRIDAFLDGDEVCSSRWSVPQLASPPLFARDRNPGGASLCMASNGQGLTDLTELESLVLPAQPGSDDSCDLFKQHMTVVDGWQTYNIPSSPTPSLESSHSEHVDELDLDQYLPSSSPDALVKLTDRLLPAKMEDHLVPRAETIGEARVQTRGIGDNESLHSFLSFLHPIPKTPRRRNSLDETQRADQVKIVTTPRSVPSSPSTMITASMLGQPPTALDIEPYTNDGAIHLDDLSSDDLGLNKVLRVMYQRDEGDGAAERFAVDPRDFILRERLDDKESYLMDVPDLPPPNEHKPSGVYMPTTLQALLPLQKSTNKQPINALGDQVPMKSHHCGGFLQEIKGFKSLNIELSWRPFNFGTTKPTHEEVAGLVENVKTDCLLDLMQSLQDDHQGQSSTSDRLAQLLSNPFLFTDSGGDIPGISNDIIRSYEEPEIPSFYVESSDDIILTAAERRRITGLPDPSVSSPKLTHSDNEDSDERPAKRIRFSSPEIFEYTPAPSFEPSQRPAAGHQGMSPSDEYLDEVEDSGVFIPEAFDAPPRVNRFSQLASDAQGFDGPEEDGEVIPDVDPLLLEDWDPWDSSAPAAISLPRSRANGLPSRGTPGDLGVTNEPGNSDDGCCPTLPLAKDAATLDATDGGLSRGHVSNRSRTTAPAHNTDGEESRPQGDILSPDGTDLLSGRSARHRLLEFMRLRSQNVSSAAETAPHPPISPGLPSDEPFNLSFDVPPELVNKQTLTLSGARSWPATTHRYLASLDLIQKRGIVRTLSSQCAVHLIEREYLDGADIVLDCETAVLFSPLRTLPTQGDILTAAINKLSWRFSYLLVVFESFPAAQTHLHADGQSETLTVNPFSPPVVKAVRKVRRAIAIAEGCYTKRAEATVNFAFPLTLVDVARSIRLYGDLAQERDPTGGVLWDDRRWLDADDEDLDERDLAAIDGMNVFAAAVILTSTTLDDFLDKNAEERLKEFGSLIGTQRMNTFNAVIARRKEAIELPSSSPPITSSTASKSTTPMAAGPTEPFVAY